MSSRTRARQHCELCAIGSLRFDIATTSNPAGFRRNTAIPAPESSAHGHTLEGYGIPPARPVGMETLNREHQRDLAITRGTGATASDWYSPRSDPAGFPESNQPAGTGVRAEKEWY